jgi:hypothetical protein
MILLHPEQWFWMHKRWKLRPAAAPGRALPPLPEAPSAPSAPSGR